MGIFHCLVFHQRRLDQGKCEDCKVFLRPSDERAGVTLKRPYCCLAVAHPRDFRQQEEGWVRTKNMHGKCWKWEQDIVHQYHAGKRAQRLERQSCRGCGASSRDDGRGYYTPDTRMDRPGWHPDLQLRWRIVSGQNRYLGVEQGKHCKSAPR